MLEKVSGKPRYPVAEAHGLYAQAVLASKPAAYWRFSEFNGPLARDSSGLERGQLVLAGAITEAVPVRRGDVVSAAFDGLGSVMVSFC